VFTAAVDPNAVIDGRKHVQNFMYHYLVLESSTQLYEVSMILSRDKK
jgi:hypothetical protein